MPYLYIILYIDLVVKSAKETGLQMHKESEDVQRAVEHGVKQLKKGLQDCSYPRDQRFMTHNMHTQNCMYFVSTLQRSGQLHHAPHPLPLSPLHPWMMMLKICLHDLSFNYSIFVECILSERRQISHYLFRCNK